MLTIRVFNVLHAGTGFLILYSADFALFSIQKLINNSIQEENPNYYVDGYINLGITYVVFGLSFILAPSVISVLGCRFAMLMGACGMATYYFLFSFEITIVAYLGGALAGYSSAITWVSQGHYVILNAHERTLARDVTLFWILYSASVIAGNTVTAVKFSGLTRINEAVRHQICYITAGLGVTGGVILSLLQKPRGSMNTNERTSPREALKTTFTSLKKKNISVLFLMFCYVGFQQGFGWSIYASCIGFTNQFGDIAIELVPITSIVNGFGGFFMALLLDLLNCFHVEYKRRHIVYAGLVIELLCFLGAVLNLPNNSIFSPTDDTSVITPSVGLALTCGFGFGAADTCFNTQIYPLLGLICPEASSQTVSLYKFAKSLSSAAFFFLSVVVGLHIIVPINAIAGVIGVVAFRWVDLRVENSSVLS